MATIHPPYATGCQMGDCVIHDYDAKRADMLMEVFGQSPSGVYGTRHAFPAEQPRSWPHKVWRNKVELLPDPRRFGIAMPAQAIRPKGRASTGTRPPRPRPLRGPIARS